MEKAPADLRWSCSNSACSFSERRGGEGVGVTKGGRVVVRVRVKGRARGRVRRRRVSIVWEFVFGEVGYGFVVEYQEQGKGEMRREFYVPRL